MRWAVSVVWLGLAALFAVLGHEQWQLSDRPLAGFEGQPPNFELSGTGFHFELDFAGTPLAAPFEEFQAEINAYVAEQNAVARATHRRAAFGLWSGALMALASLLLARGHAPTTPHREATPTA